MGPTRKDVQYSNNEHYRKSKGLQRAESEPNQMLKSKGLSLSSTSASGRSRIQQSQSQNDSDTGASKLITKNKMDIESTFVTGTPPCQEHPSNKEGKMDQSILDEDDLLDSQLGSQDFMEMSQDGDMRCEVRWDYTSPETTRQLKKMKGNYSAQDVKRILADYPDLPLKQGSSSLDRIKLTIFPQYQKAVPEKKRVLRPRKSLSSELQKERCRGVVEDMIQLLQRQQEDIQKGKGSLNLPEEKTPTTKSTTPSHEKDLEDSWSDDDLFRDNSFLIEATQNPEKVFPLLNTKCDKPKTSTYSHSTDSVTSSCATSFSPDLSVIPSSFVGNMNFDSHAKLLPTKPHKLIKPFNGKPGACSISVGSKLDCKGNKVMYNKPSSSTACSVSKTDTISHFPNKSTSSSGFPACKTSYVSSFAEKSHGANIGHGHVYNSVVSRCDNNKQVVPPKGLQRNNTHQGFQSSTATSTRNSSINSPFRRVLSFDSSFTSKPTRKVSPCVAEEKSPSSYNMSFDSSFNDELLLLATKDVETVCGTSVKSLSSTACDQKSLPENHTHTSGKDKDITNTLLSPVRPTMPDSHLKKLKAKAANSPVQSFFKKSFCLDGPPVNKHKASGGLHASTPVKVLKTSPDSDKAPPKTQTDLFLDDSFMNDDALFESQILPILKMAETQVSKPKVEEPRSPVKYSPEEIEKKRQAARQKLQKNAAKFSPPVGTDVIPPTPLASSPHKLCSQEEINQKKQEAQRKLRAKTHSTGSINVSQGGVRTSDLKPLEASQISPPLCSQDMIKKKREEALKRRQLKLKQASLRKS